LVDLVAEDERIFEEQKMRNREYTQKTMRVSRNEEQAKRDIILKALGFDEMR